MSTWEYTTQQTGSESRSYLPVLKQMGEDGWELTSVITFAEPPGIAGAFYTFFFKRRMGGGPSDEIQASKECLRSDADLFPPDMPFGSFDSDYAMEGVVEIWRQQREAKAKRAAPVKGAS